MSRARAIFDELTAGDGAARWDRIEKLVAEHEPESLWLDFKEIRNPAADPREEYLKEKLARALSGFANTEGGVLVYGIHAKDGKKGEPDAAETITLIEKPARFRAALEKLAITLTDPVVGAIVVQEIVKPSTDEGVVVVLVPESNGAPHRIVGASEKVNDRYMMRTATSVVVMPHRLLADRFGRAATPALRLTARFKNLISPSIVEFSLENVGRGAARRPAFEIVAPTAAFVDPPISELTSGFRVRRNTSNNVAEERFLVEPHRDVVIYPGGDVVVFSWHTRLSGARLELPLSFTVYALDMQPLRGSGRLFADVSTPDPESRVLAIRIPPEES